MPSDLVVRVGADLKEFADAAKGMEGPLGGIGKAVSGLGASLSKSLGPLSGVSDAIGGLGKIALAPTHAIGGLTDVLGKVGLAGMGLKALATGIGGIATGMVSGNAEMETYETQLGTLMGSADLAKQRLAELAKFGAETPFELPEVVRAEKVLIGFGLTGQKVVDVTGKNATQFRTLVGDIAAGTGASFEEIALNMGKFASGATGEAISRFQEMGIATREQMAAMGIEFSKAGELLSPIPKAMAAIVEISGKKFGGGMDKLSKTFSGQMSTLSDNFNQAKNQLMQPIFDALLGGVAKANEFLSTGGFQAALKNIAEILAGGLKSGLETGAQLFQRLSEIVPPLVERLSTFFGGLREGRTLAETVNRAFGDLIPPGLNPILDAIDRAFATVKTTIGGLIETVQKGGLAGLWAQIASAMSDFAPTGERIGSVLGTIVTAVGNLIPQPLKDFVANLFSAGQGATSGAEPMRTLAGVVNSISGAISTATGWLKDHQVVLYAVGGAVAALGTAFVVMRTVQMAGALATGILTAAQWLLNAALTANPIGLIVLAIGALVGGLIYAYQNSETFRNVVDDAFAAIKGAVLGAIKLAGAAIEGFGNLVAGIGPWVEGAKASVVAAWTGMVSAITGAGASIVASVTGAWASVTGAITGAISTVGTTLSTGWSNAKSTVQGANDSILGAVRGVWTAIPEDIRNDLGLIVSRIGDQFGVALERTQSWLGNTASSVRTQWDGISSTVTSAIGTAGSGIVGAVSRGWESVAGSTQGQLSTTLSSVRSAWDSISGVIGSALATIGSAISSAWSTVSSSTSTAWAGVAATIGGAAGTALGHITGLVSNITGALNGLAGSVGGTAYAIGSAIISSITSAVVNGATVIRDAILQAVRDAIAAALRNIPGVHASSLSMSSLSIPSFSGMGESGGGVGSTAAASSVTNSRNISLTVINNGGERDDGLQLLREVRRMEALYA